MHKKNLMFTFHISHFSSHNNNKNGKIIVPYISKKNAIKFFFKKMSYIKIFFNLKISEYYWEIYKLIIS